ncbi:MAG: hypothetical protein LBE91_18405 [Tannerella sp.]|jgi:hypothetical protein|nr:hypothetical protein [Tannerella sp.]
MESLLEKTDVARQKGRKWRKIRNSIVFVLLFGFLIWGYVRFYYPFAEGVKSGKLNYVVYKGLIFKTYEGKLIQSGIKPSAEGGIQSNEFVFSVGEKELAEQLMHAGGKTVELHYTEYFGAIPWRGYSRYVVDKIVSISDVPVTEESTENALQL